MVGDRRWAGAYGVQADFVAMSHCSVEIIKTEDIMVHFQYCCNKSLNLVKHSELAKPKSFHAGHIGEIRVLSYQMQDSAGKGYLC